MSCNIDLVTLYVYLSYICCQKSNVWYKCNMLYVPTLKCDYTAIFANVICSPVTFACHMSVLFLLQTFCLPVFSYCYLVFIYR